MHVQYFFSIYFGSSAELYVHLKHCTLTWSLEIHNKRVTCFTFNEETKFRNSDEILSYWLIYRISESQRWRGIYNKLKQYSSQKPRGSTARPKQFYFGIAGMNVIKVDASLCIHSMNWILVWDWKLNCCTVGHVRICCAHDRIDWIW